MENPITSHTSATSSTPILQELLSIPRILQQQTQVQVCSLCCSQSLLFLQGTCKSCFLWVFQLLIFLGCTGTREMNRSFRGQGISCKPSRAKPLKNWGNWREYHVEHASLPFKCPMDLRKIKGFFSKRHELFISMVWLGFFVVEVCLVLFVVFVLCLFVLFLLFAS